MLHSPNVVLSDCHRHPLLSDIATECPFPPPTSCTVLTEIQKNFYTESGPVLHNNVGKQNNSVDVRDVQRVWLIAQEVDSGKLDV